MENAERNSAMMCLLMLKYGPGRSSAMRIPYKVNPERCKGNDSGLIAAEKPGKEFEKENVSSAAKKLRKRMEFNSEEV
ncbi:hypothetical protein RB195_025189 [Necator americanus]|uniref:Uncharacterized protein n=1 Tax=Necator americanus TaxID=51031 RepID=A0ABR1ERE7_NECAM